MFDLKGGVAEYTRQSQRLLSLLYKVDNRLLTALHAVLILKVDEKMFFEIEKAQKLSELTGIIQFEYKRATMGSLMKS